jgi:hypothetical protein
MHRMATQKRRVIYMSDKEWAEAGRLASQMGLSVSGYLRALVVGGRIAPPAVAREMERIERDLTERPGPFAQFRPVPKPGQRKQ